MPELLAPPPMQLRYRGSVKDVYGTSADTFVFVFSDRYSIFDWGEMPDLLPGKGEALAVMGDLFFRLLEDPKTWLDWKLPLALPPFWQETLQSNSLWKQLRQEGLKHHSLGLVNDKGEKLSLGSKSRRLCVSALERHLPEMKNEAGKIIWDYSFYQAKPERLLVPLEVVFRFGAPQGSSFLKRVEEIPGYAQSFGLEKPEPDTLFPFPIVEFFTKLEPTDRYLPREEALQVSGMIEEELEKLETLTLLLAMRLKDLFARAGLALWDGKFEFAFLPASSGERERNFQLVDSIGPDELRLMYGKERPVHFSKEALRTVYRGGQWYEKIERAKVLAKERGEKDWKSIASEELGAIPEPLPPTVFTAASQLYPALCEAVAKEHLGISLYPEAPSVATLAEQLRSGS